MKEFELTEQEKDNLYKFKMQIRKDLEKVSKEDLEHDVRNLFVNRKMLDILENEINLKLQQKSIN